MDYLSNWSQIILIVLISILKYGLGIFTAINSSLGFWPSIIANMAGGGIGVFIFTFLGSIIKKKYIAFRYKNKKPKRFSRWNRFLIHFRNRFGLVGIAFLSPILLTIPVGVILSLQITENKIKIFFYIYTGCLIWSWVFFLIHHFFNLKIF